MGRGSGAKPPLLQSDVAGYAIGLTGWILVASLFVVAKGTAQQMPAWTFSSGAVSWPP